MAVNTLSTLGDADWMKLFTIMESPDVSECQINGKDSVWIKHKGKRKHISDISWATDKEYADSVQKALGESGFVSSQVPFDPSGSLFEGPIEYRGSKGKFIKGRAHIVLPPATDVPVITFAKKSSSLVTLDAICEKGSMSEEMLRFIKAAIHANLTMVLSGGTGAGKDLHKDTLIPTFEGFKKVSEISAGDTLFDEDGSPTKVVRKYSPLDPRHYELTFKNGEKIKAGQGHLWKVSMLNEKESFGHLSATLLDNEEVDLLRGELIASRGKKNELIDSAGIMSIIGRKGKMPSSLRQTLAGIGHKGDDLFSFQIADLEQTLSQGSSGSRKQETSSILKEVGGESVTLGELRKAVGNRYAMRRIVPELHAMGTRIFYVKSEAVSHLLKNHEERVATRNSLDTSKNSVIRPVRLMTTEQLIEHGVKSESGRLNFAIQKLSKEVEYEEKNLKIHPYVLGAWLGDGYSDSARICGVNHEVPERMKELGESVSEKIDFNKDTRSQPLYLWTVAEMSKNLRSMNLLKNKHVPQDYMVSSRAQRVALISGIMDTDGSMDSKKLSARLELSDESMVRAFYSIVLSLGWSATPITSRKRSYKNSDGEKVAGKDSYGFSFYPDEQIFNVQHKAELLQKRLDSTMGQSSRHEKHYVVDIEPVVDNPEDYFCFEVDSPNHMFLCSESFIPTHNTTMLEACTKLFPEDTRIGVCEDTPELVLDQGNVAYQHSLPWRPGMNPNDVATLSWVVQQVNRMRTDKVIVGETRGKEFADFLVAANSGMDGSLTTIHANDPSLCLSKMTNFALKGSGDNVPIRAINSDIAHAIDLIIQLTYDKPTGRHYIHSIVEVTNTVGDKSNAPITTGVLYKFNEETSLHEKVDAPGDSLRKKIFAVGIDAKEFTGAAEGYGKEPKWLPGRGPETPEKKEERTLAPGGLPSSRKADARKLGRRI